MGATLAAGTTTVPGTLWAYLTTVGVAGDWHCLELGGGNGSIAEWLAAKVGASGGGTGCGIRWTAAGPVLMVEGSQHIYSDQTMPIRYSQVHFLIR
jgi:hypothetical protein